MLGSNAWNVGRIRGIQIRIDPSWSFIAILVAYSFYVLLSFEFATMATSTRIALAAGMAVVFFLSVLVHELALAKQVPSEDIESRIQAISASWAAITSSASARTSGSLPCSKTIRAISTAPW